MNIMRFSFYASLTVWLVACRENAVQHTANEILCTEHLKKITTILRSSVPVAPDYPSGLSAIVELTTNATLFICPATGHTPSGMKDVDKWTDYIYVGNLSDTAQDPRVALLICPPENHGGQFGLVVWLSGEAEHLKATDVRKLITTPWSFASNAPSHQISKMKKVVNVALPDKFRNVYTNAYKP